MAEQHGPLESVLDNLKETGRDEAVSAGEVLDAFAHRSLGVLLTVLGLIALLPIIGGIPGMSITVATLVLIAVGQSIYGGRSLWMPDFVRRRELGRDKYDKAIEKSRPWCRRMDRLLKRRMSWLVAGRVPGLVVSLAAAVLALTLYPLAFIPWGVTPPALGILVLGLGLMACDGLLVLIGYLSGAATAYVLWTSFF